MKIDYDDFNGALSEAIESHNYDCVCSEDFPHDENDLWGKIVANSVNFRGARGTTPAALENFHVSAAEWLRKNIKKCNDF